MRLRLIIFFSIGLLILNSCRKENCQDLYKDISTHDTIFPHPYYPAYPGSWWEYNNSKTVTVEPYWQQFVYLTHIENQGCTFTTVDTIYLPLIGDDYLNYNKLTTSYQDHYMSERIIFNDKESSWKSFQNPESEFTELTGKSLSSSGMAFDKYYRTVTSQLDTMTLSGTPFHDIMVVEEEMHYDLNKIGYIITYYYAKDVGIIKEVLETGIPEFDYDLELTDYFINN